jgi:hypothetical protein
MREKLSLSSIVSDSEKQEKPDWVRTWSGDAEHGTWIPVYVGSSKEVPFETMPSLESMPEAGTVG